LGVFDLSFLDWVLPSLGYIALFMARNAIENYAVIFLTIVLGAMVDGVTEVTSGYISTVFSSIIILIILKVLCNIIAIVK